MTNAVLVAALVVRRVRLRGLLPHLGLLATIALVPSLADAGSCETYYGHPNGNLAQMVSEVAAFALLGLAGLGPLRARPPIVRALGLVALNGVNIGLFHAALLVTPHWTWLHTALIAAPELPAALVLTVVWRVPRGLRPAEVLAVLGVLAVLVPLRAQLETPVNAVLGLLVMMGGFLAARGLWRARV